MTAYHRPPDDYSPPTHCERCGSTIIYGPVIGGRKWAHIGVADHDVRMRPEGWWDTATGTTRYGIVDAELEEALVASIRRIGQAALVLGG